MSRFVLHPEANSDLDEIWEYIATENLDAADRVRQDLYQAITGLVSFPHKGHRRSDLTSRPLRFLRVRDYLIGYAPEVQPMLVVAILHGRRNPRLMASLIEDRR